MIFEIISSIVVLIAVFLMIILIIRKKLSIYSIKIQASERDLDALLGKKLSLLGDIYAIYKEKDAKEFQFLCHIDEESEDKFKLNVILNKAYQELKNYLDERPSYVPSDEEKTLLDDLFQCDIECTAIKNYYNDVIVKYNKYISRFPNNIISKFMNLEKKEMYNDPKEEEFEILKEKN